MIVSANQFAYIVIVSLEALKVKVSGAIMLTQAASELRRFFN